jgi:hypothetical protein
MLASWAARTLEANGSKMAARMEGKFITRFIAHP